MRWLDRLARREKPVVDVAARMAAAYEAAGRNDYATALEIWGPLAHAGVARAQNNVGAQAARWWRRGAERGDADAQAMLGAAYLLGSGVPRDPVSALAWLLRAQAGGSTLASPFLGPARSALDADGIAEAQRQAAQPLPEPSS